MICSAPASNLAQALLGAVVLNLSWSAIVEGVLTGALSTDVASLLLQVLSTYVMVNLVLCFFNLIPLPPLDGSKVVLFFLSGEARARYYRLEQYAMPILIVALYVLPSLLRFDPVGVYLDWTAGGLYDLLLTGL